MEIVERLILDSVVKDNILPLTSRCNMACIFCSHNNNPKGIEVYRIPDRKIESVLELAEYLDPNKKIIIGESATKIIEGEPFLYKDILKVLSILREMHPKTVIQITTNGIRLNSQVVSFLKEIGQVELVISLNSSTAYGREILMNDKKLGSEILKKLESLKSWDIPFSGSIVAMPFKVGYKDIEESISKLFGLGARDVRVFLPGFSSLASEDLHFSETMHQELEDFLDTLSRKEKRPITLEPPLIYNLDSIVRGVTINSPAFKTGISYKDVILHVNGQAPFSRVHCHEMLTISENPNVLVKRENGTEFNGTIYKKKGQSSGIIFDNDISLNKMEELKSIIQRNANKKGIVLTSKFAYPIIKMAMDKLEISMPIFSVASNLFGGSIKAAGLLTVKDYKARLDTLKSQEFSLIVIPKISFDRFGKDLNGVSYLSLGEDYNCKIELI